ncbi:pantetheine-phosphate adenylyltransferase [Schaalia vaccimaxillae]|uniref:pantetheine-phosphate adenylyltransferase n=1 Tax=Schaalia vaccimaxillae TaxID=183916 RepID=UPI0003B65A65|nr:pantetheine-phosphate adenylyltransferase [Schaalia vaccimaxillae]
MTIALVPGSFDPVTIGHIDIISRATRIADRVIVAVGSNPRKSYRFSVKQRVAFLEKSTAQIPGVEVRQMDGSLIECVRNVGADVVIKGVRGAADVEFEASQAAYNFEVGGVETLWLPTRPGLGHVSSSGVRELLALGLDASRYVPASIADLMTDNEA